MNRSLMVVLMGALLGTMVEAQSSYPVDVSPRWRFRLVELTGDGMLDQLRMADDGSLSVAVNRGGGFFEPVDQVLPSVQIVSMLHADLNGDGNFDVYLVARGPNVVLLGDGHGRMVEATEAVGLVENGSGITAEMVELTGDDNDDLVVHNSGTDVIFVWGTAGFERAEPPPVVIASTPGSGSCGTTTTAGQTPTGAGGLTPSQEEVLRHLEIVDLPDATGRPTPTLRIKGVDVQIFPFGGAMLGQVISSQGTLTGSL